MFYTSKIVLDLTKYPPTVDGSSALEYRQTQGTYNIPRVIELNLQKSDDANANPCFFVLNDKEKADFKRDIKIGIYKQLYKNGFIKSYQLQQLLKMQRR